MSGRRLSVGSRRVAVTGSPCVPDRFAAVGKWVWRRGPDSRQPQRLLRSAGGCDSRLGRSFVSSLARARLRSRWDTPGNFESDSNSDSETNKLTLYRKRSCNRLQLFLNLTFVFSAYALTVIQRTCLDETRRCQNYCYTFITSGARSAERVLLWFKAEISVCAARPDPTRPDPTRPNPTRPHHAFEKLISLEHVDRFTSGLLCSMSPFNKFHIWPVPIPTGACHGTWHVPGRGCRRHPLPR